MVRLTDPSFYAPVMTQIGSELILAWSGNDPQRNIYSLGSNTGSNGFINRNRFQKHSDQSGAGIAIVNFANKTYIAWAGIDSSHSLHFMELGF